MSLIDRLLETARERTDFLLEHDSNISESEAEVRGMFWAMDGFESSTHQQMIRTDNPKVLQMLREERTQVALLRRELIEQNRPISKVETRTED